MEIKHQENSNFNNFLLEFFLIYYVKNVFIFIGCREWGWGVIYLHDYLIRNPVQERGGGYLPHDQEPKVQAQFPPHQQLPSLLHWQQTLLQIQNIRDTTLNYISCIILFFHFFVGSCPCPIRVSYILPSHILPSSLLPR